MRRKFLLILAVPALFMLSIFFLMSDIKNIPEDTAINTPPIVNNNGEQLREKLKRPIKTRPIKPQGVGKEGEGGQTIDDDLIRPFPRPGNNQDKDDNNFNFDNNNNENKNNENENKNNANANEVNNEETNKNNNDKTGGKKDENSVTNQKDNTNGKQTNTNDVSEDKKTSNDVLAGERSDPETEKRQKGVRDAYLHAWKSYERYAWGRDELQPPLRHGKDWLDMGLSIVDSIDTMWLMGLDEEYKKARDWIDTNLQFGQNDREISFFETTIRVLGGLESMYDMTGDEMYIRKAKELGERLMPAFNTPSGYAKTTINLKTGHAQNPAWAGSNCILSEFGTVQMEFASLTKHTGDTIFKDKALKAYDKLDTLKKPSGLYPVYLNSENGNFANQRVTLGALGDSFYEYLLKYWILTGKRHEKYRRMYEEAANAVIDVLVKKSTPSGLTYIAEKDGNTIVDKMDHLVCFAGAMFALAVADVDKHMKLGEEITNTCHEFYNRSKTGLGPEIAKFRANADFYTEPGHPSTYILRPETVESYMVLYWITGDKKYQDWGWEAFQAIEKHCKNDDGYCGIRDVNKVPADQDDVQQSFFMAETLKYLYLLFSPRDKLSLDQWVFNTEAHPLRVWS